jgi:hypothetical protein
MINGIFFVFPTMPVILVLRPRPDGRPSSPRPRRLICICALFSGRAENTQERARPLLADPDGMGPPRPFSKGELMDRADHLWH